MMACFIFNEEEQVKLPTSQDETEFNPAGEELSGVLPRVRETPGPDSDTTARGRTDARIPGVSQLKRYLRSSFLHGAC